MADGTVVYIDSNLHANSKVITIGTTNIIKVIVDNETFVGIYRTHKIDTEIFLQDLSMYLNSKKIKNHYIFGDINIDILHINHKQNKYNSNVDTYLDNFHENGFISVINNITTPSNRRVGGTCIDHIFLKASWDSKKFTSILYQNNLTDHYSTFLKIENFTEITKPNVSKGFNYNKLLNLAKNINWDEINSPNNVNFAMNKLIDKVNNLVTQSEYLIKRKQRKENQGSPWD